MRLAARPSGSFSSSAKSNGDVLWNGMPVVRFTRAVSPTPSYFSACVRISSRCGSIRQSRRRRMVNGRITPPYWFGRYTPRSWSAMDHTNDPRVLTRSSPYSSGKTPRMADGVRGRLPGGRNVPPGRSTIPPPVAIVAGSPASRRQVTGVSGQVVAKSAHGWAALTSTSCVGQLYAARRVPLPCFSQGLASCVGLWP